MELWVESLKDSLEKSEVARQSLRDALFQHNQVQEMLEIIAETAQKLINRRVVGDLRDHRLGKVLKAHLASLEEARRAPKEPKMREK